MPRKQQNQNNQNQQNQQQGGMTTSAWGVKTYGDMGQQSAAPGSNVIAIKGGDPVLVDNGQTGETPVTGAGIIDSLFGSQQKNGSVTTGGNLGALLSTEVLTPIVLTVASNQVANRLGKTRKTRGGDMTTIAVPALLVLANNQAHKLVGKNKSVKGGRRGRKTQKK
jgi:hypothetical protein